MSENKYFKKIAKLQYKVNKFRARANFLKERNRFKKSGKFEGKAQHYENKIPKYAFKLAGISANLKNMEINMRDIGNIAKAESLLFRIKKIDDKISSIFKTEVDKNSNIAPVIKEIIRTEMVRIPCNYCGTLNDITDKKCSSCGGSIGN